MPRDAVPFAGGPRPVEAPISASIVASVGWANAVFALLAGVWLFTASADGFFHTDDYFQLRMAQEREPLQALRHWTEDRRNVEGVLPISWGAFTDDQGRYSQGVREWYWRPVPLWGLMVQWHLFDTNPMGYHAVSLALFALGAWLVSRLALRLGGPGASGAACVYMVTVPSGAEAATWVAAQGDLWVVIFVAGLGGEWMGLRRPLVVMGWGALALMSKDSAVIILPWVLALGALVSHREPSRWRATLLAGAGLLALTVLYVLHTRFWSRIPGVERIDDGTLDTMADPGFLIAWLDRLVAALGQLALFLPPITARDGFGRGWLPFFVIYGAVGALLFAVAKAWQRGRISWGRVMAWTMLVMGPALAPLAVILTGRSLSLAAVGAALAWGMLWDRFGGDRRWMRLLVGVPVTLWLLMGAWWVHWVAVQPQRELRAVADELGAEVRRAQSEGHPIERLYLVHQRWMLHQLNDAYAFRGGPTLQTPPLALTLDPSWALDRQPGWPQAHMTTCRIKPEVCTPSDPWVERLGPNWMRVGNRTRPWFSSPVERGWRVDSRAAAMPRVFGLSADGDVALLETDRHPLTGLPRVLDFVFASPMDDGKRLILLDTPQGWRRLAPLVSSPSLPSLPSSRSVPFPGPTPPQEGEGGEEGEGEEEGKGEEEGAPDPPPSSPTLPQDEGEGPTIPQPHPPDLP